MNTPLDRYLLYILFQFENFSGISGFIYTPYETLYKITSPSAFHASSVRHSVNNLERAKFLEKITKDQISLFTLTKEGKEYARKLFHTFLDETTKTTANIPFWWGVIFDIPESKRNIRDSLRTSLIDLGFVAWQKSVYVYPGGTSKDELVHNTVQQDKWAKYVSLFSIERVHHGTDLLEFAKKQWEIDKIYVKALDLVNKANYVSEQSSKKALNKHQIASLKKDGQAVAKELFNTIEQITSLPVGIFPTAPHEKIAKSFYKLTTSLTKL